MNHVDTPPNRAISKGNESSSNHGFSEDMLVVGGVKQEKLAGSSWSTSVFFWDWLVDLNAR